MRLFDRASDLACGVFDQVEIAPSVRQQLVCAALFGRLIRAAQACCLLALRGLEHDAVSSLRHSLEILVYLKASCSSEEFVEAYLRTDFLRRAKLAAATQKMPGKSSEERALARKHEAHWRSQAKKHGAKKLIFEQVCQEQGMSDHYNTVYRLASDPVHAVPRILEDFVVAADGEVTGLKFGPHDSRFVLNIVSVTEYLLGGVAYFSQLTNIDVERQHARIKRDLSRAAPDWDTGALS